MGALLGSFALRLPIVFGAIGALGLGSALLNEVKGIEVSDLVFYGILLYNALSLALVTLSWSWARRTGASARRAAATDWRRYASRNPEWRRRLAMPFPWPYLVLTVVGTLGAILPGLYLDGRWVTPLVVASGAVALFAYAVVLWTVAQRGSVARQAEQRKKKGAGPTDASPARDQTAAPDRNLTFTSTDTSSSR